MSDKLASRLNAARQKLQEQNETIEEQQEKIAQFEREKLAEEIVEMQIASGKIDESDFVDQRRQLVESDKDLNQVKTAMKHAGPGFGSADSTVEVEEGTHPEKEADYQPDNQPSEPEHVKEARRYLEQKAKSL